MTPPARGQIRRGQVVTTWGPGALLDLPEHSAIMAGLDKWPGKLGEVLEPRLSRKLEVMTGVSRPRLYAPPAGESRDFRAEPLGIGAWRFPEWFLVQEPPPGRASGGRSRGSASAPSGDGARVGSRRLVHRKELDDRRRFDGRRVVPVVFVQACPKGHVDDVDWRAFVHPAGEGGDASCRRQLWLDETGTAGDLGDLVVRCECGSSRRLYEATDLSAQALGTCTGARPWLGAHAHQSCGHPARLLVRTATNAYFPQIVSVLSLPNPRSEVRRVVEAHWGDLQIVEGSADEVGLQVVKRYPHIAEALNPFDDERVLEAIEEMKGGGTVDQRVKPAELAAILNVPEGYGDDVPIDPKFHARRLPRNAWRLGDGAGSPVADRIECVVQLHRLREVLALVGFTRFEATAPDIHGEYESDVERADLALDPEWFPAVENRGEGVFVQLSPGAVQRWLKRDAVQARVSKLQADHDAWIKARQSKRAFPGGPYILLHTLSHLLIQSLAMRCGYPAASIRERVYAEDDSYGLLLYTGSPDADGTLGGLVQQARQIVGHLEHACRAAALCSNDPICAQGLASTVEGRQLLGAACHACALVAETSCEMRNDYLDRALVVPVVGQEDAAFFPARSW